MAKVNFVILLGLYRLIVDCRELYYASKVPLLSPVREVGIRKNLRRFVMIFAV